MIPLELISTLRRPVIPGWAYPNAQTTAAFTSSYHSIRALEQQLPCPLPTQICELLLYTRGFANSPLDSFEFVVVAADGEVKFDNLDVGNILPSAIPLAGDGFGNYWVVDLTSTSTTWGPIFFVCHDPPVYGYQANDLTSFIYETFRLWMPPHDSAVDWVHEDAACHIWENHPGVQTVAECRALDDADLRTFAHTLDHSFLIIDLRSATVGDGYAWGRFGANTVNKRFGEQRIFAYQQHPSRWQRLLGRQRSS